MSRFRFFDDEEIKLTGDNVAVSQGLQTSDAEREVSSKKYRYRVEQTIIMKINGMIVSHGVTKQEYLMQKNFGGNNLRSLGFELVENVLKFNPDQLEVAIDLICELDKIKALVEVIPNQETGKMLAIADKSKALLAWNDYKKVMAERFSFLKSEQERESINAFVDLMENQLNDDVLLLNDYESRIFYDLIFDRYLLGKESFLPSEKNYLSNLFPHHLVLLNVAPFINQKTATTVSVKQVGVLDPKSVDQAGIVNFYDENYKPQVGYRFSDYNYSLIGNYLYETVDNILLEAELTITEEVKNNVEMIIDYRLKRVEL